MRNSIATAVLLAIATVAYSHGGRLNSEGCHNNRKTGEYHCHRSQPQQQPMVVAPLLKYERDEYLPRWADADRDCQNTRHEVLIAESLEPVTLDARGCKVIAGRWYDLYSGQYYTDPSKLDIDHMVPLKEAHVSGAASWPREKKRAFANDLELEEALIAVSASQNRSKGSDDPASWLPADASARCAYVLHWVAVKDKWGLGMDVVEAETVNGLLGQCP